MTQSNPRRVDRRPLTALVVSLLVGPIGIALGLTALFRRPGPHASGRALATAAVVVGVIQTLAIALLLTNYLGTDGAGSGSNTASPTASPSSTSPPTSPVPTPPASPSEADDSPPSVVPSDDSPQGGVGALVGGEVAGFEALGFSQDPAGVSLGALEAYEGSYSNGRFEVAVRVSSWASPEAAAAAVVESAEDEFSPEQLIKSGDVGSPTVVGSYLYYERDGQATLLWNEGQFMVIAQGDPYPVQEFFAGFPRQQPTVGESPSS